MHTMTGRRATPVAAGLALLLFGAAGCDDGTLLAPPEPDDSPIEFLWAGDVARGGTVEIKGLVGSIRALPSEGPAVRVEALLRSRGDDPAGVRIDVVRHGGGVTLCAVYPTPPGHRPNECAPGGEGRLNTDDYRVGVDFVVHVPAGVRFAGLHVNGPVIAERLESFVDARTVNGDVRIETTELAEAGTVNGSIVARLGGSDWAADLAFATVNGDVDLEVSTSASARVQLATVHGSIASDFPLDAVAPGRAEGTIGAGEVRLTLTAVNGDVTLRRGR